MNIPRLSFWNRLFSTIALSILLVVASAKATDVRGRVQLNSTPASPYPGIYPAAGFQVFLAVTNNLGQLVPVSTPSYTGPDGMYYLARINPSSYLLVIVAPNGANWRIPVTVFPGVMVPTPAGPIQLFDLAPVTL